MTARILWLVAALGMAPVSAAGFTLPFLGQGSDPAPAAALPPRPVVTEIPAETAQNARSVPGVIAAQNQVTLAFQTLGRLTGIAVDLGDAVAQGTVLARLDPDDLDSSVRAAEAAAETARVRLATATATAERTRELRRRNVAAQAQLEQAEQALVAATAAVEQAESQLVRARDAAGFAEIRAPFDGVVSAMMGTEGTTVSAGAPILTLAARDGLEAVIDLPETAVASLPPEARFAIWQENDPTRLVQARLDRIEPIADSATRMRRLHLALTPDAAFRLGTLIRARLDTGGAQTLTLPEQAVHIDGDGVPHIWVVDRAPGSDTGTVRQVAIETGLRLDGRIAITGGLPPDAEVVTRGVRSLSEGQIVGERVAP